jgi:hypothetical protein
VPVHAVARWLGQERFKEGAIESAVRRVGKGHSEVGELPVGEAIDDPRPDLPRALLLHRWRALPECGTRAADGQKERNQRPHHRSRHPSASEDRIDLGGGLLWVHFALRLAGVSGRLGKVSNCTSRPAASKYL